MIVQSLDPPRSHFIVLIRLGLGRSPALEARMGRVYSPCNRSRVPVIKDRDLLRRRKLTTDYLESDHRNVIEEPKHRTVKLS